MAIEELLAEDFPEEHCPIVNNLQRAVTDILAEHPDPADNGDSPLILALAEAVCHLEVALVKSKTALLNVNNSVLDLRAYIIGLETRLLEAGVDLGESEVELEPPVVNVFDQE